MKRRRLFFVEGLNAFRHRVGEYFWATTSGEARALFFAQFGSYPNKVEVER
jgi:hypothetical protein